MTKPTNESEQSPQVPIEYAGQVIAWDSPDCRRIVASGRGYDEARQAAQAAGFSNPVLERVPDRAKRFIGYAA